MAPIFWVRGVFCTLFEPFHLLPSPLLPRLLDSVSAFCIVSTACVVAQKAFSAKQEGPSRPLRPPPSPFKHMGPARTAHPRTKPRAHRKHCAKRHMSPTWLWFGARSFLGLGKFTCFRLFSYFFRNPFSFPLQEAQHTWGAGSTRSPGQCLLIMASLQLRTHGNSACT